MEPLINNKTSSSYDSIPLNKYRKFASKREEFSNCQLLQPAKKRKAVVGDEAIVLLKKRKIESVAKTIITPDVQMQEVVMLSKKELMDQLKSGPAASSKECFQALLSLCTGSNNDHSLWLEIPRSDFPDQSLWIHFIIDTREYDSQCFSERVAKPFYYFINGCHETSCNDYYFQIRIDQELEIAELIHIEKGMGVSGNEMKEICMAILDFLNPKTLILNDDSKVLNAPDQEILLRVSLPIVSPVPKTWYENFKPMFFDELLLPDGKMKISQPFIDYKKTVALIRNTCIANLVLEDEKQTLLEPWMVHYLKGYQTSDYHAITVHQLGSAIYAALRGADKLKAHLDFNLFYVKFLDLKNIPDQHVVYKEALNILYHYKIFETAIN